jgi:hypothetical protein
MQMEPYLGLKWINSKIFRKMIELDVLGSIRNFLEKFRTSTKDFFEIKNQTTLVQTLQFSWQPYEVLMFKHKLGSIKSDAVVLEF